MHRSFTDTSAQHLMGELMNRLLAIVAILFLSTGIAFSQISVTASAGFGPFAEGQQIQNTFSVVPTVSRTVIDSVTFQITSISGTTTQTWATQKGSRTQFAVNMGTLPWQPEPQLIVTAYMRPTDAGSPYTTTRTNPITISAPEITYTASNNFVPVRLGYPHSATYGVSQLPANTTQATVSLVDPSGKVVATNTVQGTNLTQATLAYSTQKYPGALRLQASMRYTREPPGGYTAPQKIVPDSIPAPIVSSSAGFGPFNSSADNINTFVVQGLGPGCLSVEWSLQYITPFGEFRSPVTVTRTYNTAQDSMHFVYNMRDVSPGTSLVVTAIYGTFTEQSATLSYPFTILTSQTTPSYRFNDSLPLIFGVNRLDTVVLDSLPARITTLTMLLTTASGAQLAQAQYNTVTPTYVRSGKLTFNGKDLPVGTYFIRSSYQNDDNDDPVEFDYEFDVRDTSKFFLAADTWGPFTQGDSATITLAVADVRPVQGAKPDRVLGRFALIDSLNPTQPLARSVPIDLSGVVSRDSILYWPDSSYVLGEATYTRAQIQTVSLPLSTVATFERLIVRGADTTTDNQVTHTVVVVPEPGVLSSVPRMDTTFTVTRSANLTFTLSDITPSATAVRFAVYGMKDLTPVAQQEFGIAPGENSVSWFTNPGALPVNAKVVVNAITPVTGTNGAVIVRLLNTVPDTLSMQSSMPIDTLRLGWNVNPTSKLITGVAPYTTTLTFSRIPAQTNAIVIVSRNDRGNVIDSIRVAVPYRTAYDATLTVATPFTLRAFNTAQLSVMYLSDGGPQGGVRYQRNIVSVPPVLSAAVRKVNTQTVPISTDPTPIRQGSNDVVDLSMGWSPSASNAGYISSLAIDSVLLQILDCSGSVVDQHTVRPTAGNAATGVIADTMYTVTKLPLSTSQIQYRIYSQAMTLPIDGVAASASLNLVSDPILSIPLGFSYPSYRVTDTNAVTLSQVMYLTNVNGLYEIDSVSFIDRFGRRAQTFASQRPRQDTIWFPGFDFNQLDPDNAPYTITGLLRIQTCEQFAPILDTLGVVAVPRVLADPARSNWVYSSKGWGPFQQGRAPTTLFVANFDPSAFITTRSSVGDSLEVSIVGVSQDPRIGVFTADVPTKYIYPANQALSSQARTRASINLTPFDTVSSIALHVRWIRKETNGASVALDNYFKFPVAMLEFPDQTVYANTTGYEQSVLAGSAGPAVMQDNYDFTLLPESSSIDSLKFTFTSSSGYLLDAVNIAPTSRNTVDTTSVFKMLRDVAQYPWPYIARNRTSVAIEFGYQFTGAVKPTKYQSTGISILPRADWLNGTTVTLDGTATSTSVPIKASIPMPTSSFAATAPLFGTVQYGISSSASGASTAISVQSSYNPTTKQFTMRGSDPGSQFWTPSVTLFGGANISSSNVASDGQTKGEFTALYRFEESSLGDDSDSTVANRELRIRSLFTSNFSANSGMATFIEEMGKVISDLMGEESEVESGGTVEVKPLFVVGGSIQQVSTINIGTEESGTLVHLEEDGPPTQNTEQNAFPTSQAVGLTLTGGGGLELSFLTGVFGVEATVTNDYLFASGSTFSGAINNRRSLLFPTTLNPSTWFNLEISVFWGLIKIDVFRGCLYKWWSPLAMPSFPVFTESWESIFAARQKKTGERTQSILPLANLPEETPYYRPAPVIASTSDALLTVHLEQSELDHSGRLVLSRLDRATHSLRNTAVISSNRNAMHDPTMTLIGKGGNAFIAWIQNERNAGKAFGQYSYSDLLTTENVVAAFYDASSNTVQMLPSITDASIDLIDGKPTIAAALDSSNAMIAWPALAPDSSHCDIYVRRIFRVGSEWQFGDARLVSREQGADRDVDVEALEDGTFLVTWINDGSAANRTHTVYASIVSEQGATTPVALTTVDAASSISDIEMASNGRDAVLLFGRSLSTDSDAYARELNVFTYKNGTWSNGVQLNLGNSAGVYRHVEADLNEDGRFFAMINLIDHDQPGAGTHKLLSCTGSINERPSAWKIHRDHPAFSDQGRSIWSMSASIGPDHVFYVATQELDSVRQNVQSYRNGLRLGARRLNSVIRAMKLTPNGELVTVPFGNQPTSVNEGNAEALEEALRYRPLMMDAAPNPARQACVVPLAIQRPTTIDARLYDAYGQLVTTIFSGSVDTGIQGLSFEVTDIPSGHYSVVLTDEIGIVGTVPVVVVH